MKLPSAAKASLEFQNAPGSSVPEEYALAVRQNPADISVMAETPSEVKALQKEALARQYVLIVDMSGSMTTPDRQGTRWDSAKMAVEKLVETVFKYDIDHSIPLYLFDDRVEFVGECTDVAQVTKVFDSYSPRGTTDLAQVLNVAMEEYIGCKRPNYSVVPGVTFIVILDGSTDDNEAVKRTIQRFVEPANGYIDNHTQLAISFIQIGDDPAATAFLKDLDDNCPKLDVVDMKQDDVLYTSGGVDAVLFDAIFD